ncbi:MAG: ABC transporter permease [Phycisphaerae bacterium]|nr:ABC transporter permease [Phycisphaerae bacterium]MCZ2399517.1 ABC transporter permease [Phycisphaerae bacterium]NUQ48833.1 ABC transporter permease [Phycisphaerae bacterium]
MRSVWAVARLTFWEGLRMRVVLVVVIALVFVVLRLPFALRGDETLAGRLQTFLSYSLTAVGFLVAVASTFLACATLANEFKTQTLHLVVTKPVSRFQILIGKWLGVNLLGLCMLILCALVIYGFAVFIKNRPALFLRDALTIRDVIWTARTAASPTEPDFLTPAREMVKEQVERQGRFFAAGDQAAVAEYVQKLRDEWLRLNVAEAELYEFEGLLPPERPDTVYQVRYRVRASSPPLDDLVTLDFQFRDPDTLTPLGPPSRFKMPLNQEHQFLAGATPMLRGGRAALLVGNPPVQEDRMLGFVVFFESRDSLKVLYRVGSFEMNYTKAVLFIFLHVAFLSAVGVFFSTFTSFPVAAFCTFAIYALSAASGVWLEAIGANDQYLTPKDDPYGSLGPFIRALLVPLIQFAFPDLARYSGIRNLIDGYYIRLDELLWAAAHTLGYGLLLLVLPGWLIFRAREAAEVQV